MARLQRPLNPDAVRQADDTLYARHAGDPRPNALYDADGNRLPLSPTDPAQADIRNEWCDLYSESLNKPSSSQVKPPTPPPPTPPPPPDPPPTGRSVTSPVEPCPQKHWIQIQLIRHPDVGARPAYWPPARTGPYASEKFSAEITDGHHDGVLDGQGQVRYDGIPAGSCSIRFTNFYPPIDKYFDTVLVPRSR